jgi:hypothetical protein
MPLTFEDRELIKQVRSLRKKQALNVGDGRDGTRPKPGPKPTIVTYEQYQAKQAIKGTRKTASNRDRISMQGYSWVTWKILKCDTCLKEASKHANLRFRHNLDCPLRPTSDTN